MRFFKSAFLLLASATFFAGNVNATVITVTVTGAGQIEEEVNYDYVYTDVNEAQLVFSYDTDDFVLTDSVNWSGGQGKKFSTPDQELDVTVDGVSITGFEPLNGFSIYNQFTRHDQINFEYGGSVLMQWNDFTSGSFNSAPPSDMALANALALETIANNPNMVLANNSVRISQYDDNYNQFSLEIFDAVVTFSEGYPSQSVSTPTSFALLLIGLAVLTLRKKRA